VALPYFKIYFKLQEIMERKFDQRKAFLTKLFLNVFESPEAVFSPKQTVLWKRMRYQRNNYFSITQSLNDVQS
jgi:hypothetical protein